MTEEEILKWEKVLKHKEQELYSREVIANSRERDIKIYEARIMREYEKLFPHIKVNLRQ